MNESLCASCKHCMLVKVENVSGGSGNREKIICLILPDLFTQMDLVHGHYKNTQPYPKTIECNKYEKRGN